MRTRSHEDWLTDFNDILRRYRQGATDPKFRPNDWLTWDGAIERLEDLGFTKGEAMHMLQRERRKAGIDLGRQTPIPPAQRTVSAPTAKRPASID